MERNGRELVSLKNVSVAFNSIPVLKNISLDFYAGEVHTIIGENGAGKSTLMKVIYGIISPNHGEVIFLHKVRTRQSIHQIIRSGISMIHQELMLVPELTVEENIFLGQEPAFGLLPWKQKKGIRERCNALLQAFECTFKASDLIKNLSIANQQLVEIIRAVSQQAKLILMDEPTSSLSDHELSIFTKLIEKLKNEGVGIIFTSHKMQEIFSLSDKISVLRDGEVISTNWVHAISQQELVAEMVGRDLPDFFPTRDHHIQEKILEVRDLTHIDKKFNHIHFDLRKGEVLGMAGLVGAGRSEIGKAIAGIDSNYSGSILLHNKKTTINSPRTSIKLGIGYVGEDRKITGFVPRFTISENITLSSLDSIQQFGLLQKKKEAQKGKEAIKKFSIKHLFAHQPVQQLSGGNQQKVVLAKILQTKPEIIILDEPTRGIDVHAKHEIYLLINQLVKEGKAIILISSDLPELIHLSDRVLVLSKGKQTALLEKQEIHSEKIIHFAMM